MKRVATQLSVCAARRASDTIRGLRESCGSCPSGISARLPAFGFTSPTSKRQVAGRFLAMLKFFSRLERTRGVVIISFAVLVVLGLVVAGYNRSGGRAAITNPFKSNEPLARVNGEEVTVADFSLLKKKIE